MVQWRNIAKIVVIVPITDKHIILLSLLTKRKFIKNQIINLE